MACGLKSIRMLLVTALVLCLCGCFGRNRTETIVLVEPGDTVEVTDDKKVNVRTTYKDSKGEKQDAYDKRSIAGTVAMPKSVYRKMRHGYQALYDYVNGKIDNEELKRRLKEEQKEIGAQDDKK